MNERVLTRRLRELEEYGLLERKLYAKLPLRAEYSLTETGKALLPILNRLGEWGGIYNEENSYGEVEA